MQGCFRTAHHGFDLPLIGIKLLIFLDVSFLRMNFHGLGSCLSKVVDPIKLVDYSLLISLVLANVHSILVNCHP